MTTLKIKNLPDELYQKLKERAKEQRRSVTDEAIAILSEALEAPGSILKLCGLGKELWKDVEPATHVESERKSWD